MFKNMKFLFCIIFLIGIAIPSKVAEDGLEEAENLKEDVNSFYIKLLNEKQEEVLNDKRM